MITLINADPSFVNSRFGAPKNRRALPLPACKYPQSEDVSWTFERTTLRPMPTREEAWQLVCEWTESDSLRKHMLAVETAVRAYARRFGADEEMWGIAGLVHDLDYERYPDLETGHPRMAIEELRRRGYPDEVVHAVQAHAEFLGVPAESLLDKTLIACDELSGFIAACAYVRPEGIHGMKTKSVKKKLKQPSFAAGVHRDEVYRGAAELEPESGLSFDEHVQFVIDALAERAGELGLEPDAARS
jgi:putative nucleotidyltransferase with HDIG domain